MSEKLCVVMPVYNEQDAIGPVLVKWAKALDALTIDYIIRPYNDGSKDASLQVMRETANALPRVEVRDKANGGHGNTILTGYREAAVDGFDWIFQIDSDDEMGPEKFGELWSHRNDYDFLVGIRDGRVQALPRKIISFVSRCCVKVFYGRKTIWDVNTPYRLMRTSALQEVFWKIPLTTFAPNLIISGMVARKRLRFFETRVSQHERRTGEVSIKKLKLLKAAAKSFCQTILFSVNQDRMIFLPAMLSLTAVLGSLFMFHSSPIFAEELSDSAVFSFIGRRMVEGGIPYVDMFDHKGPLLYLITALGFWLGAGSLIGVWVVEISLFIVGLLVARSMVKPFLGRNFLSLFAIAYCVLFHMFAGGGCRCETYIYFFSLISISCFMSIVGHENIPLCRLYSIGISIACILMIKFNMAIMVVPVGMLLIFRAHRDKSIHTFVLRILAFLGGIITVFAPIFLYLYVHSALESFWDSYVRFNYEYRMSGGAHGNVTLPILSLVLLTLVALVVSFYRKNDNVISILSWSSFIFVLYLGAFLLSVPQANYFLPVVASTILPLTMGASMLIGNGRVSKGLNILFCMLGLGGVLLSILFKTADIKQLFYDLLSGVDTRDVKEYYKHSRDDEVKAFLDIIPTSARDSVWVVGNCCWVYFMLDVKPKSRYSYTHPIYLFPGRHSKQILTDIETGVNEFIILQHEFVNGIYADNARCRQLMHLLEKAYNKVAETYNGRFSLFYRR